MGLLVSHGTCMCMYNIRITRMFCKHQALFWLQVLIITITEFVNMPLMLKGNVRGDRANLKRTEGIEILWFGVWVFCLGFFQTSVTPLLLASLLYHGQFSDLLTVCQGARDTTTEVTRTGEK